jgi:hypothetical protein
MSLLEVDTTDIVKVFTDMESRQLRPPYRDEHGQHQVAQVWLDALPGVQPAELKAAIYSHLDDPLRGRHWPLPGQVVAIINRRRPPEVGPIPLSEEGPAHLDAWLLALVEVQNQPRCQASDPTRWMHLQQCTPCMSWVVRRTEELAGATMAPAETVS